MLVLTRFAKEGIRIGDDTMIHVLGFERGRGGDWQVRIGIQAPQSKTILREELWNEQQINRAGEENADNKD